MGSGLYISHVTLLRIKINVERFFFNLIKLAKNSENDFKQLQKLVLLF